MIKSDLVEGDLIVRIWPSGNITMGRAVKQQMLQGRISHYPSDFYFESLEDYKEEGRYGNNHGVHKNSRYGTLNQSTYQHRPATEIEVKLFTFYGKLQLGENEVNQYYRELQLNKLFMEHKDKIERYTGTVDELVEDIGNLKYDALAHFLHKLANKLHSDAHADNKRGRIKLSNTLWSSGDHVESAALQIDEAWRISEPFMK